MNDIWPLNEILINLLILNILVDSLKVSLYPG